MSRTADDSSTAWRSMKAIAAFSTLGCGDLEIGEVLALAAARGLPSVELRTLGGTTNILAYFTDRFARPAELRALVAASGVAIASVDTSVEAIHASAADRDWLLQALPWIVATGAPRIRVFDGGQSGADAELDSAGDLLAWWTGISASAARPIEMAIETHDVLAQPAILQRFLDRVPAARILWDTHHTWKEGGESPAETWRRLRGRTDHLHIKDSGIVDGTPAYVPPGRGKYPFGELLQALAADGFAGTISLEWERHWFPELPPIAEALDGFEQVFGSFQSSPRPLPMEPID